ncbi:hypothetical protein Q8F55_008991 [Vanrija albida]|uniref:Multicopper oxidase n=1 Tax=Vanrija albida TaxID=181172 RepID=A0ABR3PSC8_9TREE
MSDTTRQEEKVALASPAGQSGSGAKGKSSTGGKNRTRNLIAGALAVVVVLGVALGVGLGVGLKKHHHDSTPALAPGNTSDITAVVSRAALLGDLDRWQGSKRNFSISSTPTTRTFNWTIDQALSSPGALTKPVITINGLSPGPVLEANLGDRVIVHVYNNMTNETAIHWHALKQNGTNYYDGTYSITQCGVPPKGSFTYNFTVQDVGTTWYHAHKAAQYTDGLFGPIIFHAPNETAAQHKYDDEYTFILNDQYNTVSTALEWRFTATGTGIDGQPGDEPSPDGGMINGVSQSRCAYIPASDLVIAERRRGLGLQRDLGMQRKVSQRKRSDTTGTLYPETNHCGDLTTDYYNVTLEANSTYRIRLINAGTFTTTVFSIDGHNLTVVEADGVSIEPFVAQSVELAVAQRYSVLVTLDQKPGAYWIRNVLGTDQLRYTGPQFNETTLGVLRYAGVDTATLPADTPAPDGVQFGTMTPFVPADKVDAPQPTVQQNVAFNMQYTADNKHYMFFNQTSWTPLPPGQMALSAINASTAANATYIAANIGDQLNYINPSYGVFDLVVNSQDDGSHPFHMHGHTFFVMSQGTGHFYGDSSSFNTTNPMRRDTIFIPSYGHVVLRMIMDNPGIWAFHCHITWHMEIGLLLTLTNLPSEIAKFTLPDDLLANCKVNAQNGW